MISAILTLNPKPATFPYSLVEGYWVLWGLGPTEVARFGLGGPGYYRGPNNKNRVLGPMILYL